MKLWTVHEGGRLPYGNDDGAIPEAMADRLAAVARASPLAGQNGSLVLEHGRHALRAGQMVGIVVARDCALEILPKIDGIGTADDDVQHGWIRDRLIHMLAVALDLKIAGGPVAAMDWQKHSVLEILIRLFADHLFDALRSGLPRGYVGHCDDLRALRGRLNVIRQFTVLAAGPQKIACTYDELSPDIVLNRIMKAAVTRLRALSVSAETQRRLAELAFTYADVADMPVSALPWYALVLDRTNGRWRDLVDLARLLLGGRFQTTALGDGTGFSLLFPMNILFEKYVARLLARSLRSRGLRVVAQGGLLYCMNEIASDGSFAGERFRTKPDVLVKRDGMNFLVLDTKWKRLAPFAEDTKHGVSQADIYQMMAYNRLYKCPNLMLLYPHHAGLDSATMRGRYNIPESDDRLVVATINLAEDDGAQAAHLAALVETPFGRG
jgi:5-methylcytosine-specific restriction enzyme subunit McrC